jgi:hypothetical protein
VAAPPEPLALQAPKPVFPRFDQLAAQWEKLERAEVQKAELQRAVLAL